MFEFLLEGTGPAQLGQAARPEDVRAKLPACYSQEFDKCLAEFRAAERQGRQPVPSPYCDPFYKVVQENTSEVWDAALTLIPYCPAPTSTAQAGAAGSSGSGVAVAAIIAGALGLAIGAAVF